MVKANRYTFMFFAAPQKEKFWGLIFSLLKEESQLKRGLFLRELPRVFTLTNAIISDL